MTNAAANPASPSDLWATLRTFVVNAFALFGAPSDIARQHFALRTSHAPLLGWLAQCEALLRRLIFLDAAALAPNLPAPAPRAQRAKGMRPRRFVEQDPDASETWRVRFSVFMGSRDSSGRRGHRRSVAKPDARFTTTWPAAERFEALIRAFNDPTPHVRRLARILRRRPACAQPFARQPKRRYGAHPLEEEIAQACDLATAAARSNSS